VRPPAGRTRIIPGARGPGNLPDLHDIDERDLNQRKILRPE
jgi:hypothetical protein